MNAVPKNNLNMLMDYTAFILRLRDATNGAKLIQGLQRVAQEEWDRSFDADTEKHLIEGVFASLGKTEAVKGYIAKVVALHIRTTGNRLAAWTKETVTSENSTNLAISNRIAAIEFKSSRELFILVATRLLGYDDALVKFAIEDDLDTRAKYLMDYMSAQFDLVIPGEAAHLTYIDQTVDLSLLLKTDGFDPQFFSDHIYHGTKFYEVFDGASKNLWDIFSDIDVIVGVNRGHQDSEALYNELTDRSAKPASANYELVIDVDDPDPATTIEMVMGMEDSPAVHGVTVILAEGIEYSSEFREFCLNLAEREQTKDRAFAVRQIKGADDYLANSKEVLEKIKADLATAQQAIAEQAASTPKAPAASEWEVIEHNK